MPIIVSMLTALMKVVFMSYSGNFPLVIPASNYVLLLVVGVVAYAFVAFLHVRRVKRVPLELAMKISE
jgi:putative ABC transport system permease protein